LDEKMTDMSEWIDLLLDKSYKLDSNRRALLAKAIQAAVDDAYQQGRDDGYYESNDDF
jgi:hypothetical protein